MGLVNGEEYQSRLPLVINLRLDDDAFGENHYLRTKMVVKGSAGSLDSVLASLEAVHNGQGYSVENLNQKSWTPVSPFTSDGLTSQ